MVLPFSKNWIKQGRGMDKLIAIQFTYTVTTNF